MQTYLTESHRQSHTANSPRAQPRQKEVMKEVVAEGAIPKASGLLVTSEDRPCRVHLSIREPEAGSYTQQAFDT